MIRVYRLRNFLLKRLRNATNSKDIIVKIGFYNLSILVLEPSHGARLCIATDSLRQSLLANYIVNSDIYIAPFPMQTNLYGSPKGCDTNIDDDDDDDIKV